MKKTRLRRALLPTWPPESVSEAMLLLLCAAALRLLIVLWLSPGSTMPAEPDLADAGLAMLSALARPMALGLMLALAARVVLGVAPGLALGLGALFMVGTWAGALVQGVTGAAPATINWLEPLCVGVLAFPAARLAGKPLWAGGLLGLAAAVLVAAVAQYDAVHGLVLDAWGLSVRGALVFSLEQSRREGLDALPLLMISLVAWMLAGSVGLRRTLLLPWIGGAWPIAVAGAACMAWGYVRAGVALDAMPGILQPPSIYGVAAFLAGLGALLAMVALLRAHRQGAPRPSPGTLGLLTSWSLALTWLAAAEAPVAAALIGLPLALPLLLKPGGWADRPAGFLGGAVFAVLLWMAGATLVPGAGLPMVSLDGFLLLGLLAAGAGFGGLYARAASRPVAALCIVLLCGGLAALALEAGRGDMLVLCAVMLLLLGLGLLLPRGPKAVAGNAAFCCLALLSSATALFTG